LRRFRRGGRRISTKRIHKTAKTIPRAKKCSINGEIADVMRADRESIKKKRSRDSISIIAKSKASISQNVHGLLKSQSIFSSSS
jgi:hypothetical protein